MWDQWNNGPFSGGRRRGTELICGFFTFFFFICKYYKAFYIEDRAVLRLLVACLRVAVGSFAGAVVCLLSSSLQ